MIKRLKTIFFILECFACCLLNSLSAQSPNLDFVRSLIDKQPLKAFVLAQKIEINATQDAIRADALSIQGNALLQINNKADFEKAIEKHQKALTLRRQIFGIQSLETAYSLVNLGNAFWENQKQDSIALTYYLQAINIFEHLANRFLPTDDSYMLGNTQRIVADIYLSRGDFKTAQKTSEKAVKTLHTEGGDWLFAARLTLGRAFYYNDKIVDAFRVLKQAETMQGFAENNKSVLYAALADCLEVENTPITNRIQALNLYEKALNASTQTTDVSERSKYLNKIGEYYLATNQTEKALFYFKKAINELPQKGFEVLQGTYLTHKGNAYRQKKQLSEARKTYEEALQKLDNFPVEKLGALTELAQTDFDLSTPQSALILRGYFHTLFGGAAEVCMRLGQAEQALLWAERGKAFLFKKQRLSQNTVSLQTIQNQLKANNRLLMYSFGRQSLTVFVVTHTTFSAFNVDTAGITEGVKKLVENIRLRPQNGSGYFHEEAYFLYQKLIAQTGLQTNEDVIVVPDDILHFLPFEVLLSEKPNAPTRFNKYAYLLKNHRFSYHSSAINTPINREKTTQLHKEILAFAPISDFQQQGLEPLQHNQREVDLIGKIWSSKILRGSAATKTAFINEAPFYRLIHVSTHGIIPNGNYPERSYLAFSPDTADNGIFTMSEMDSVKLSADLVVLSACETAHGKYYGGEGLMSIAHAFLSAGAKNIVASLWQVNDSLTTDLMTAFYQNLKNGETVESALQKAKLLFAEGEKAQTAHPYYWAAFVFSSEDATAVRFTEGVAFWQKILSFLVVIAAAVYLYFRFWRSSKTY
jgi:CHAT domain-containing protein